MTLGRPRTSIPEDEELIELGKDLVLWASEKKEGELRCRWAEWFAVRHHMIRSQWLRMIDTPSFRAYYEEAQVYLGGKYIDGTINPSIAQRYLRVYDPELRASEDLDLKDKALLQANALKNESMAIEEYKLTVLNEVQRNKRELT